SFCSVRARVIPARRRTAGRQVGGDPEGVRGMSWRGFADRYGVSVAVVALLALVVALLPGNADQTEVATGAGSTAAGATSSGSTVPGASAGGTAAGGTAAVATGGAGGGGGTAAAGAAG